MAIANKVTPYEKVQIARDKSRLQVGDFIEVLFDDFIELKGDRLYADDKSILGGIAMFHGIPVTVIGQRKGKTTEENIKYNFGMTSPEGYRKALRLMKQAEKFGRPVILFVDTPGAFPGLEAENRGQSIAIAESIAGMSSLEVPTISIITGEGSSGGALALATADSVWMLENSIYAILSPEGFASIMWKDSKRAQEASEIMKITASELKAFGLIDGILPEGSKCIPAMDRMLQDEITKLTKIKPTNLVRARYRKIREIDGIYKPERR